MIKNFKWLALASLVFVACNNDDAVVANANSTDGKAVTSGTANLSKYVALGDSFAAGFSDGALFIEGQKSGYPNILAQQFAFAGGGEFLNPLMNDNVGGFLAGGVQSARFGKRLYLAPGNVPTAVDGTSSTDISAHLTGPFNNYGIPGAKCIHLAFVGYGSSIGNPYFARMASSPAATVLSDALAQNPTFFSLWIGGNDVLGYATNGGVPTSQDAVTGDDITPVAIFDALYKSMVTKLVAGGTKGVVANLPYVSTLPYFTTVPYNPLSVTVLGGGSAAVGGAAISALNTDLYTPLITALTFFGAPDRIKLLSATSANPLLIKDEALTNLSAQLTAAFTPTLGAATAAFYGAVFGQARQATAADFVTLPTQSAIGAAPTALDSGIGFAPPSPLDKFGITFPLQDKHVLTATEVLEIKVATDAYNVTIAAAASANGLAFVDTKAIMEKLNTTGIVANGYTMKSTYVTGNSFSLDGVHPSPRGYALIANYFLTAINTTYGSNIKGVNLGNYRILYPKVL
ncbi:G-D-S-L family lipolytic protein [Flavobacterium sp. 7A]|uniref:G-D-S-L family lipolytic protein n=1 Tax=Flavobacterium sp. 7A TaxID=2940571 RepID=UPI0022274784|nr:G-D-S-L family lipolytic protein [Flavobacterium sp. 7A]MCW2120339.1 lysophospholipase L1-like esterase [Flavobacterium sp. 7A]